MAWPLVFVLVWSVYSTQVVSYPVGHYSYAIYKKIENRNWYIRRYSERAEAQRANGRWWAQQNYGERGEAWWGSAQGCLSSFLGGMSGTWDDPRMTFICFWQAGFTLKILMPTFGFLSFPFFSFIWSSNAYHLSSSLFVFSWFRYHVLLITSRVCSIPPRLLFRVWKAEALFVYKDRAEFLKAKSL